MEELKDIKDIVDVQEYSLFILIGLIIFGFLTIYLFKNRRKRRKKPTEKEQALERLERLDYSNTKDVVYTFEEQVLLFVDDKNRDTFTDIQKRLEIYKYKKDIPTLDKDVESEIKTFIKGLK